MNLKHNFYTNQILYTQNIKHPKKPNRVATLLFFPGKQIVYEYEMKENGRRGSELRKIIMNIQDHDRARRVIPHVVNQVVFA